MKIFTCTTFHGHYPVGTAAVMVAKSKQDALNDLNATLNQLGLTQPKPITLEDLGEVNTKFERTIILCDGNY